ncbi:hypothetical protein PG993_008306 [Apiospora rasikravindrae]|uniref:Uncharacterized protein n=1 Tax=Apiospora rasikravindrae TaxID=990691 RepID=A0ABR1SZZ4_9PEZI
MAIETLQRLEPLAQDGFEFRQLQAQTTSPAALHQPSDAGPASTIDRPSFTPSGAGSQIHASAPNATPSLSSIGLLFGQQLSSILDKFTEYRKALWKEGRKLQKYQETSVSVIAFAALLMAGVALWPTITAASDGHKSELLAEWAARKDFLSNCEEHNWPSPTCDTARKMQLEAPPNFDHSGWKRYVTPDWTNHNTSSFYDNIAQKLNGDSSHLNISPLILAFPRVPDRGPQLRISIIGPRGWMGAWLMSQILGAIRPPEMEAIVQLIEKVAFQICQEIFFFFSFSLTSLPDRFKASPATSTPPAAALGAPAVCSTHLGEKHTTVPTADDHRRVLGLRVPVFWGVLIALILLVAGGIGGGIGGGLATQGHNSNSSSQDSPGSRNVSSTAGGQHLSRRRQDQPPAPTALSR